MTLRPGHWREVLRATPMRLTLRLVVLFVAVSLTAFAATYWLTEKAMLDAIESQLEQQIAELAVEGSAEGTRAAVARAASRANGEHLILRYDHANAATGNYVGPLPGGKLRLARLTDKENDVKGRYVLRSKEVAGGMLTVGQDTDALDELREIFARVLGWTLLPTVLLVLGGGLLIARRATRRLTVIEATLNRLSTGDMAARLPPMPGPRDDLTRVGAGIDRLAAAQEAAMTALRQVSADIAHDLRTPIQRLSVLLDQARAAAPDLVALEGAEVETRGIVATFDALLRIAQIEGGKPRAHFAPVDLERIARTMAELYEPAAEESGHRLSLTLRDPATVSGDRTLIGQAMANLIENALRHSPPGPIALDVQGASITVADHGPGIPAEEREAVRRRLYRLDRSRSTPGNGLALVDAIATLHGGRLVLADNHPGLRISVDLNPEGHP